MQVKRYTLGYGHKPNLRFFVHRVCAPWKRQGNQFPVCPVTICNHAQILNIIEVAPLDDATTWHFASFDSLLILDKIFRVLVTRKADIQIK
jgi:hypothetical protein